MIVENNFLTNEELKTIENEIIGCNGLFPWFLTNSSTKGYKTPYLSHTIIPRYDENEEPTINSESYYFFKPIIDRVCEQHNIPLNKMLRMCINLTFSNTDQEYFAAPHVDHEFEHKNCIIYLNDCSGSTVLFDDEENIIHEVEPKKGKILIFDGLTKHSMRPCKKDEERIILVSTFY